MAIAVGYRYTLPASASAQEYADESVTFVFKRDDLFAFKAGEIAPRKLLRRVTVLGPGEALRFTPLDLELVPARSE